VLLGENLSDAELVQNELQQAHLSFDTVRADTQRDFQFQLEHFRPDIVVADYTSETIKGEDALKMVRQTEWTLPFIFLSPPLGEERAVELLKQGATDIVLKSNLKRLVVSINRALKESGDVAARTKVEEAYKNSMNRYRDIVENATEIIYSMDLTGYFLQANAAALKTCGYSIGELWKMTYLDLILPEHRARVKRHYMRQFLAHELTSRIEFPFRTKQGDVRWFEQSASAILEGNTIVGFNVIAHDLTHRIDTNFNKKLS
jgi:PAS domain S-box-containing protein